ncbi:MAG: pantoate--beta-alanine ligase [Epulopiscium sp. Nuni2H_MBin003]|nr:MAG: pantoate--beta-alanine ligase [Epulopiscium sp. Nuni2H_MBin003]
MEIITTIDNIRSKVKEWKLQGLSVGFVPTMGYLHEGHISLVNESNKQCDKTIASIFVNPSQFGPNEDFEAYPRDFDRDCSLLEANGCDIVFYPEKNEIYPENFATYINIISDMPKQLCGKSRPIHFQGVCTVVAKLFNIVTPDKAFFGEKDAQQLAIIKKMVADLNIDVKVVPCPIIREEDGLAKSSRNTYLNKEERIAALILSKSIFLGKSLVEKGERNADIILSAMIEMINSEPMAKIDYVDAVDGLTMLKVKNITGTTLFAMAVNIGKTRLIDNFVVEAK